jgi:predicted regulator of Ras-like GTPase activity (Roadblock/LC7/MglB family)
MWSRSGPSAEPLEAETILEVVISDPEQESLLAQPEPAAELAESETVLEEGIPEQADGPNPSIQDFEPPVGPLRERLKALMDWLLDLSGSHVAFIVDRDGLPLVERHADPDLLAIASRVMDLIENINGKLLFSVGQAVTIELDQSQLILVSVETPIGKYIVGQVGDQPMSRDLRSATARALRRAFQPSVEPKKPVSS